MDRQVYYALCHVCLAVMWCEDERCVTRMASQHEERRPDHDTGECLYRAPQEFVKEIVNARRSKG